MANNISGIPATVPLNVPNNWVSPSGLYAITWTFISICTLLCAGRVYIRAVCFGRLWADDWLTICAWALLVAEGALGQVYLAEVFRLTAIAKGAEAPGPDLLAKLQLALHSNGAALLGFYVGVWAIKFNYLLFFKRIAARQKIYIRLWYLVLVVTTACGLAAIGMIPYRCFMGTVEHFLDQCTQASLLGVEDTTFKISCVVDVVPDALIMCFPIILLWKVQIETRKKMILIGVFFLIAFTMIATIMRGTIFTNPYEFDNLREGAAVNVTWIWFWFFLEYSVSLIVACVISFRALFVRQKEPRNVADRPSRDADPEAHMARPVSRRQRARDLHDNLMESFRASETID